MVKEAKELGYTEPDPRDDLSGVDFARKVVILARECSLSISLDNVKIESLVPEELRECDVSEFLSKLSNHDKKMEEKKQAAEVKKR